MSSLVEILSQTSHFFFEKVTIIIYIIYAIQQLSVSNSLLVGATLCCVYVFMIIVVYFYCTFVIQCGCRWNQLKATYLLIL